MPNHVMNIVRFSGDEDAIRQMREAIQNPEYGIGSIDFNRIIPMPPSLDMEESSCTRAGLRAYQDFIEVYTLGGTVNMERLSDIPAASEEAFLKTRKDVNREMFALGKQAWNNLRQYGKATWYGWCTDNWGTKWNAYGFDEAQPLATSDDVLAFQTAWNAPHPVMKAFSAQYPAIRMEHWWADEDVGFNCGKRIYHDGTNDILPSMGNRATLTVYAPDGTVLLTQKLDSIAVPAGKCNLIWFRWTVPDACAGQTLRLECTVNADGALPEDDKSNNSATVWVDVKECFVSVTSDPTFDGDSLTELPTAPSGSVGRVRWNEWVYTENGFVLKEYTVTLSGTATVTPNTGGDTLRGGGGFSLTVTPTISGDIANATDAQSIFAAFPEFSYRTGMGECCSLEQMPDGRFCFPAHPSASARVHFLPLGIADGTYTVFLQLSGLWTPAGQVSATVTVRIPIAGTVYDGFYIR